MEVGGHALHFAQAFGERGPEQSLTAVQGVDLISAVRFSSTGDMIATGDKGGRIVLLSSVNGGVDKQVEFRFWTQFQSHEPEFDYLKSMEIEEKINRIRWLKQASGARRMLTTNDKTIKLFRIDERDVTTVETMTTPRKDVQNDVHSLKRRKSLTRERLRIPKLKRKESVVNSACTKSFANAHAYHINSLSINSDDETFLSADDLRVNIWHLGDGSTGFNILDIKPENMEDLNEVITCAEFHPLHCNLFAYSTSRAAVKLMDLRMSALCEGAAKEYLIPEDSLGKQTFFSEIVASISDLQFSPDGRYFVTRDYESLRIWDLRWEKEPQRVMPIFPQLSLRLMDLYENDCIFDRFQCAFSHDGEAVVSGSYNGLFSLFSCKDGKVDSVEASVDYVSGLSGKHLYATEELINEGIGNANVADLVEPTRRILHTHASPVENVYSVACGPALYIFHS